MRHIGESLGVANILEGSVRKSGESVRITAQLVKVDDGFHLWSETYDRKLDNIFEVQDEIAGAVVSELKLALLGDDEVIDPMMQNAAAHDAYLQGLAAFNLRGPENYAKAAAFAEQALELEPQSALTWALVAKANVWVAAQGSGTDISQSLTRARMAVSRAMALNDKLPEAYAARAELQYMFDWDWQGALESTDRALELRPGDVGPRMVKKDVLEALGRLDEAKAIIEDAQTLDPNNRRVRSSIAGLSSSMRNHKLAEAQRRQIIADFSGEYLAGDRSSLAWELYGQGLYEEAVPLYEAEPINFLRLTGLAAVYHKLGKFDEASAAQQELLEAYGDAASYQQAEIFAEWGELDTAMDWLHRAYLVRDPGLNALLTDYSLDPLRDKPDFKALLKKMNLVN
jgi:tetratricopeptide (TPR) repeat protein